MILHRISETAFANDLSGYGSLLHGGRWNAKGVPAIYTSTNHSLAKLELIGRLAGIKPELEYSHLTLQVPDDDFIEISDAMSWSARDQLKAGTNWLQNKLSLGLMIPSVHCNEYNVVLNPRHPDSVKIVIEDIQQETFDSRFFRGLTTFTNEDLIAELLKRFSL